MTGPDEISGRKAAGISGRVTVKDKIEYKKVDVTDEIKKESEINVAKEDTAIAPAVESVLQDTVEWVASTKTPAGNGQEYEEVGKSDIPEACPGKTSGAGDKYAYFAKETQIAVSISQGGIPCRGREHAADRERVFLRERKHKAV